MIIKYLTRCKVVIVAFVLLASLLFAGGVETRAQEVEKAPSQTSGAQPETEAPRGNPPLGLLRVLNLTPEQRAQIGAIRRETEPEGRVLGARLRQARRALDEAMYSENPDERQIEERVREVGAAQAAVVRLRTLAEIKIRRVLTPEQLNAFRRLQRQSRMRQQGRTDQTSPQGNFPAGGTPAERHRNRMERRRQERQQQQQPVTNNPTPQPLSTPRERRRAAPLRNPRPPR